MAMNKIKSLTTMVLIAGLVLASYSIWIWPAWAQGQNPLTEIEVKLDQILNALSQGTNHTLRWDTNNPSASRFVTAFTGAVLDKNTGLVWEQAPDSTTRTWLDSRLYCVAKVVGGTRGWRLPSIAELTSIHDPTLPAPFVPATIFTGILTERYWSSTTDAEFNFNAWATGFANFGIVRDGKAAPNRAWCVRGPMQESVY